MSTLMVLDGNSLLNRAFYGVKAPLTNSEGQPTGALLGFLNILLKLTEDHRPDALCVAFDLKAPTFRHDMYDGYKAQRKPMPEDLASQMPLCKELLDAMNIKRYELPGYEADDLLGTVSRLCAEAGWDCAVVTGDRDAFQLVGPHVSVLHISSRMGRTETIPYDEGAIQAEYGMTPHDLIDLKALMGDASDNIPGVPGVGEKTALDLMHRFGSLSALYEGCEASDLKPGVKNKLAQGRASAELSRKLAEIDCHAPLPFAPEEARRAPYDTSALSALLRRLEFRKLSEKLGLDTVPAPPTEPNAPRPPAFAPPPLREVTAPEALSALLDTCKAAERVALLWSEDGSCLYLCVGGETA
ncbi:MAG: DNA polymerase I, partial [Oscillospiraceae bacterium]|nr:DNA polymerase I [Oscillospiraceae bacterium]